MRRGEVLLEAVGEAAQERRGGILLAIDELQYLQDVELAALITAIHRTTQPVAEVDEVMGNSP